MDDTQPPATFYDSWGGDISQADSTPVPDAPLSKAEQELADLNAQGLDSTTGLNDLRTAISDWLNENSDLLPDSSADLKSVQMSEAEITAYLATEELPNIDTAFIDATVGSILDSDVQAALQPTQESNASAGDPVNLATGQFEYSIADFTVPGAGIDFVFSRTYKSGVFYQGPLGANWDHSANLSLYVDYDWTDTPTVTVSTGQLRPVQYFFNQTFNYYVALGDSNVVVFNPIDGTFQKRSPDGVVVSFKNLDGANTIYPVARITDRFGNFLQFNYEESNGSYLLSSVFVNSSARVVNFLYYDDAPQIQQIQLFGATYLRDGEATLISRTWAYVYDDFGDLVTVTGPATDDFPSGRISSYQYSSPSSSAVRQHDLLNITDPNGNTFIENVYGSDVGTVAFGRVVNQRVNDGVFCFEWEDVLQDPSWTYSDAECPTSCVTVVQRNGHSVCYTLSANGNILLSWESVLGGAGRYYIMWRYAYDDDGRRIATLSPQGRVSQVYYGREYFYDENYPGAGVEPPLPWQDPYLSQQAHNQFSNVLATVQRGEFFGPLDADTSIYDDIFTPVGTTTATDIIVNYTYESSFQQRASTSDPRFTTSVDADSGDPEYVRHLTVTRFPTVIADPAVKPAAIEYPSTTYPAPLGVHSGVTNPTLTFDSYNAQGRLLQYTLPERNIVSYSYFAYVATNPTVEGFLASKTVGVGSLNLISSFAVNEAGQTAAMTDALGNTTQFGIDPCGLIKVTAPPLTGFVITCGYDGNCQVVSRQETIVEPDGTIGEGSPEVANYAYNAERSPVLISVGDNSETPLRQTRRNYDSSNCLVRLELPQGNSICYEYDERLLLKEVTRGCCSPSASSTSYSYDLDGLCIAATDPRGGITASTRDAFGRPIGITDPLGTLQRIDYDNLGNALVRRWFSAPAERLYQLLVRIEFEYDERNQLVRQRKASFKNPIATADPWDAPDAEFSAAVAARIVAFYDTLYFRDGNLRLIGIRDANGSTTFCDYDAADRRVSVTDPTGSSIVATYDGAGNIVRSDRYCTDASGALQAVISTLYAYDTLNHLVATTDGAGNRVVTGLDSRGLPRSRTDALGHVTEWTYNPFRDRITETQVLPPIGPGTCVRLTTTFSFDANSNVVGVTDPRGNMTSMEYDVLDQIVRATNPDGSFRSCSYDRSGNQTEVVDEDGTVVSQAFDAVGNLLTLEVQSLGPQPRSAEQWATFQYNGVGVLVAHQNAFLGATLDSDSLGRCYQETLSYGAPVEPAGLALNISRQFDGMSNLTQLNYPSGQILQYSYDSADRLVEINSIANAINYPGGPTASARRRIARKKWWGYLIASTELGNGVVIEYSYDSSGRRISDRCNLTDGHLLLLQQLWDGASNRRLIIEQHKTRTRGSRYDYDSANRMVESDALNGPRVIATAALGPPTAPLAAAAFNGQADIDAVINGYAVRTTTAPQLAYDAAGNRISERTRRGTITCALNSRNEYVSVGSSAFKYNRAGRLVNDSKFSYAYNFCGQLVQAIAQSTTSAVLEIFHDALGRVIGCIELGSTRALVTNGRNVVEMYTDENLSSLYIYEGTDQACFLAADDEDQYIFRDVLESTRLVSDGIGTQLDNFRYDPFGTLVSGTPTMPILYSGKYRYASIEWYEYERRQYIPKIGRFAQPDPAGFVDGANLYSFMGNNPLSGRDPTGTTGTGAAQQTGTATAPAVTDNTPSADGIPILPQNAQGSGVPIDAPPVGAPEAPHPEGPSEPSGPDDGLNASQLAYVSKKAEEYADTVAEGLRELNAAVEKAKATVSSFAAGHRRRTGPSQFKKAAMRDVDQLLRRKMIKNLWKGFGYAAKGLEQYFKLVDVVTPVREVWKMTEGKGLLPKQRLFAASDTLAYKLAFVLASAPVEPLIFFLDLASKGGVSDIEDAISIEQGLRTGVGAYTPESVREMHRMLDPNPVLPPAPSNLPLEP